MITDRDAEKAADWIRDNATQIAEAKANRVYLEEYRKSIKAILFCSMEGSAAERENKSYAHEKYTNHLNDLKNGVIADEELRALKCAAEMKIEVWRTQQANQRGRI